MLRDFFWVIPRRLNYIYRRFGTHCLFHLRRQVGMKYGWIREKLEYLYGKRFGSKIACVWALSPSFLSAHAVFTSSHISYLPAYEHGTVCSETSDRKWPESEPCHPPSYRLMLFSYLVIFHTYLPMNMEHSVLRNVGSKMAWVWALSPSFLSAHAVFISSHISYLPAYEDGKDSVLRNVGSKIACAVSWGYFRAKPFIIIIIFINCNWVVTRWQWLFYM